MQFDPNIPIYIQIMDQIKRDLITGKLKGGDKLASVREMADTMKVNPNTVQRVYQELEREKVTYTQRGMGTFITEDGGKIMELRTEMTAQVIEAFVKGMMKLGFSREELVNIIQEYLAKEGN